MKYASLELKGLDDKLYHWLYDNTVMFDLKVYSFLFS